MGAVRTAEVEFVGLRSELDPPASFSWGTAAERNVGLVKVVGDDGVAGWGETSVTFPLWSLEERAATVKALAPMMVGRPCETLEDIAALVELAERNLSRLRLLWSPVAISASVGALEMALLDAWGRRQGKPVWSLLGGERGPIDLYAVGFAGSVDEQAEHAAKALAEGYAAVKVRVGFGEDADLTTVSTFRRRLGDDARILADANMGWDRDTALHMSQRLERFDLGWLEEPVSRDDPDSLRKLADRRSTPLAAGENCYTRAELLRLAESGTVRVLMPDLARCGGFAVALAGAKRALELGLEYSTHHYASDVGFAAMLALCTVAGPSAPILRDISRWPLREQILSAPLEVSGGKAWVPETPGLAPEPDPVVIERNRVL